MDAESGDVGHRPSVHRICLFWHRAHFLQSPSLSAALLGSGMQCQPSHSPTPDRGYNLACEPDSDASVYALLTRSSMTPECSFIRRNSTWLAWVKPDIRTLIDHEILNQRMSRSIGIKDKTFSLLEYYTIWRL